MTAVTITPLEALRRLVAAAKLVNSIECQDLAVWNGLQGEIGVADGVMRDYVAPEIHCQEFHELAMDYRAARPVMPAAAAYDALCDYINARIAPVAAQPAVAAPQSGKIELADGYVLMPEKPTPAILRAMAESRAVDDEGEFPMMLDLLDFSGENKTRTALEAAYIAAMAQGAKK